MEFCMRIAHEIIVDGINKKPDKNFVISPLSLNCLLNMLASGSKGHTLEQLLEFLQCDSVEDVNAQSSRMINLIWGQSSRHEEPGIMDWSPSRAPGIGEFNCQGNQPSPIGMMPYGQSRPTFSVLTKPQPQPQPQPWSQETAPLTYLDRRNRESSKAKGPELSFVGGIWIDKGYPLKPSYQQIAKDVYKAESKTVDFGSQYEQVRLEVNVWAERETKGHIKDLLPPNSIDEGTILALANALYFKGNWRYPFEESRTRYEDFHLLNRKTIKVPFMTTHEEKHFYASFKGFKVLKLPYANGQDNEKFSMYIFLPDNIDGLQELMQNLSSQSVMSKINSELQPVYLSNMWIPKFKFSYGFEASDIIKKFGLTLPFMPFAELTEMVDCPDNLYVSKMFHKASIEVNEKGTEAAAASCVLLPPGSPGSPFASPDFVADHPFMFMIKEEMSSAVFFTGTVLNPLKEN